MSENEASGRLRGQTAIVTGGAGGIGGATVAAFHGAGANVVVVDRDAGPVEALVEELRPRGAGELLGLACDVRAEADMERMAGQTLERFGRIDVLITSAGVLRAPGTLPKPMVKVEPDEWQIVIDVNLKGVFLSNRAVLPTMIGQRSGLIVNVSSTSGRAGRAHDAPYCASKFGVIGLTESVAEEVRPYGVKVQAILPDAVATPLWDQNGPIKPDHALEPERVADLLLYMAELPQDTLLVSPVIAPFRTRRRKRRKAAAGAGKKEG